MLAAIPLIWRLVSVGIVVAAIGGGVAYWSIHQYNKGWDAAIQSIAAKERKTLDAVKNEEGKVDDCVSSGGMFDTVKWVCSK